MSEAAGERRGGGGGRLSDPAWEAVAGAPAANRIAAFRLPQPPSPLLRVHLRRLHRVPRQHLAQPGLAARAQVVVVARVRPGGRMGDVAMLDGVVVNIVEARPQPALVADAGVPVAVPDRPAHRSIKQVDLARRTAVQPVEEDGQPRSVARLQQQMVMVVENSPGSEPHPICRQQRLKRVAYQNARSRRGQQRRPAVDRRGEHVPGVVAVDVRRSMSLHSSVPAYALLIYRRPAPFATM